MGIRHILKLQSDVDVSETIGNKNEGVGVKISIFISTI